MTAVLLVDVRCAHVIFLSTNTLTIDSIDTEKTEAASHNYQQILIAKTLYVSTSVSAIVWRAITAVTQDQSPLLLFYV